MNWTVSLTIYKTLQTFLASFAWRVSSKCDKMWPLPSLSPPISVVLKFDGFWIAKRQGGKRLPLDKWFASVTLIVQFLVGPVFFCRRSCRRCETVAMADFLQEVHCPCRQLRPSPPPLIQSHVTTTTTIWCALMYIYTIALFLSLIRWLENAVADVDADDYNSNQQLRTSSAPEHRSTLASLIDCIVNSCQSTALHSTFQ